MLALYKNEYYVKKQRKGEILPDPDNGKMISNPSYETYLRLGYLPLIDSERPEYDPEKEYLEVTYELEEKDILIVYTVKEIQPEPEEVE